MNSEDPGYGFRFMCKDFEIEIRGDQRFVDKILGRYENRVMLKLRELLAHAPAPEPRKPEPPHAPVPTPTPTRPPEAAPPQPGGEKKSRRHRGRGRRGKRRQENVEAGGLRPEREPAPVEQTPLLRGGDPGAEAAQASLFSESAPDPEFSEPAFTPPPLSEVRPAAVDFPARRRTPKADAGKLKTLLDQRRPRTHHDRIMLMGYHLENAAAGSDFTAEELMECYRVAGETPPANLTQVLNHATRSGFMLRHDQGRTQRFKLSARGRRYVEDGLKLL